VFTLGKTVYRDMMLAHISDILPDLYHVLSEDLNRRLSKDEQHRWATIRQQAIKNGMVIPLWPVASRVAVGAFLVGLLSTAGILDADVQSGSVSLSEDILSRMSDVKVACALALPFVGPCVARPLPRTGDGSGGFHTARLQGRFRLMPTNPGLEFPETVCAAVTALQDTAWQINPEVLEVVREVARTTTVGEIVSAAHSGEPRPPRPASIPESRKTSEMSEAEKALMARWKTQVRKWHEKKVIGEGRGKRFASALRMAERFKEERAIYFVWFADSRGRLYPASAGGVQPQGSDVQKGLLRFADGMPLHDKLAERWFRIHGANKFGFDKATLDEREQWSHDRHDLLMVMGMDPVNNLGWAEADKPIQFLAWVLEYAEWHLSPVTFVSHLPVSMDGSCNGLQNLSACLRDEIGGRATNITANTVMEDIYRRVAEAATVRMQQHIYDEDEGKEELRGLWMQSGISRSLTKRSVMTTPYGVTRRTAEANVVIDSLRPGAVPMIPEKEYFRASIVLMDFVWPAIGDVVVKGTQLMDWLKRGARKIIKELKEPRISWTSPSGFPSTQTYYQVESYVVTTKLWGKYQMTVQEAKDIADPSRHASGMAPNFVHSLDAAHLHLVAARCKREGITSLSMIHDDMGTHAANAQKFFHIIREEFYGMYSTQDPVNDLLAKYPMLGEAPSRGTLDLEEVLRSDFFFS
jgi:DNA-directed RNA polymerase